MRKGIIGGGNLVVDYIKIVDYYPNKNMMCNIIKEVIVSEGGSPHNVLVTLSKLNTDIPLSALGLVGNDSASEAIFKKFKDNNIDSHFIEKIDYKNTSYTDVITEHSTGHRTFFHYAGANAELDYEHFVQSEKSNAKIFFLGNLLHLDKLDLEDEEFGLSSAKVLSFLVNSGFKTAVDLVSVKSDLFPKITKFCLKYINYLNINEIEAQSLSGFEIRTGDELNQNNLNKTGEFLIKNGVIDLVVIHFPEGGFAIDKDLKTCYVESFKVNKSEIKSAVGCGDAFNAGMLFALHEGLPISEGLRLANACARFCLFDFTTTGSATSLNNIKDFISSYVYN